MRAAWIAPLLLSAHVSGLAMIAVRHETRQFTVQYVNGSRERYVVEWVAAVDYSKHESGGPSIPLQGKLFDDRRCHWTITVSVRRLYFLVNAQGKRFERLDLTESDRLVPGTLKTTAPVDTKQDCNSEEARFQQDLARLRDQVAATLAEVAGRDAAEVERMMRGWPHVRSVTPQAEP